MRKDPRDRNVIRCARCAQVIDPVDPRYMSPDGHFHFMCAPRSARIYEGVKLVDERGLPLLMRAFFGPLEDIASIDRLPTYRHTDRRRVALEARARRRRRDLERFRRTVCHLPLRELRALEISPLYTWQDTTWSDLGPLWAWPRHET